MQLGDTLRKSTFSELLQVAAGAPTRSHDGLPPEDRRGRAPSSSTCSATAPFAAEAADAAGAAAGGRAGVAGGPAAAASAGRAADRARWEARADESAATAGTGQIFCT